MKIKNLLLCTLLASQVLNPVFAMEHDHAAETADYEVMYFGENTLDEHTFDYTVLNRAGEMVVTPLGQTDFPHAAIAYVSRNQINSGVVYLSNAKSAFADTQDEVSKALEDRFYAIEDDMIFLDSDGQTIVDSTVASFAIIPNVLKKDIASLINVALWKECSDTSFTGNYSGFKCSKGGRQISADFKKFLNGNLKKCVNAGLKAAKKGTAKSVHVTHAGIVADKNHNNRSLHAVSRAMDIKSIIATIGGKKVAIDYGRAKASSKSWQRKFYHSFGSCWSGRNIARDSRCKNRKGSNGQVGVIRWENKKHGRHMHLSMPMCGTSTKKRFMK